MINNLVLQESKVVKVREGGVAKLESQGRLILLGQGCSYIIFSSNRGGTKGVSGEVFWLAVHLGKTIQVTMSQWEIVNIRPGIGDVGANL